MMIAKCTCLMVAFVMKISATNAIDIDKVIEEEFGKKVHDEILNGIRFKYHRDLDLVVANILRSVRVIVENGTDYVNKKMEEIQNKINDLKDAHDIEKVQHCMNKYEDLVNNIATEGVKRFTLCSYTLIGQSPYSVVSKIEELRHSIDHTLSTVNPDSLTAMILKCGGTLSHLSDVLRCVILKSPDLKQTILKLHHANINGGKELLKLIAHNTMHEACLIEVINQLQDEGTKIVVFIESCLNNKHLNNTSGDEDDLKDIIPETTTPENDLQLLTNQEDINKTKSNSMDTSKNQESLEHQHTPSENIGISSNDEE